MSDPQFYINTQAKNKFIQEYSKVFLSTVHKGSTPCLSPKYIQKYKGVGFLEALSV